MIPTIQGIKKLISLTTTFRGPTVEDEMGEEVDEPPEPELVFEQDKDFHDEVEFKRQSCVSPPRNQSSLLSKMLASPVSTASDLSTENEGLSDSTSRNTTPTPPPLAVQLPAPMLTGAKGIIRRASFIRPASAITTAAVDEKCKLDVIKRNIKFVCTGKESSRESSIALNHTVLPSEHESEVHIVHPQPQRILKVDDVLQKERQITRLNAEVEAEDFEKEFGVSESLCGDLEEPENNENDNEDDQDGVEEDEEEDEDEESEEPDSVGTAPGSIRGKMLARLEGTPFVEYESDSGEETAGNIEDGYASDDDGEDDEISEYNGPISAFPQALFLEQVHRLRPMLHRAQGPATPPANMMPDSSDFVCGTFDEDKPIEVAFYCALEEHARFIHKPCPQDIDPSFPEEEEEEDSEVDDKSMESETSRRVCRSPPPAHKLRRSPPPANRHWTPLGKQKLYGQDRNRPALPAGSARYPHSDYAGNENSSHGLRRAIFGNGTIKTRQRGAIDIVKGLERKNNHRRSVHTRGHAHTHAHTHAHAQQQHDVMPGTGVAKMRQIGLDLVRKGENPYSEWMLSV
ncbi:hypothetical protein V1512DRAFT_230227 [Lipomyces arxii]|uniref:uncharacterized protein n=1 Tax=Lipomyces arxii TaxID=56418 RepID=UPI0034CD4F96